MKSLLSDDVVAVRGVLTDTHPVDFHALGLTGAIDRLTGPLRKRGTVVHLDTPHHGMEVDRQSATLLYRAAQELLSNVYKFDDAIQQWTRVPSPYTPNDAEQWFALTRTTRAAGHQAAFAVIAADGGELLGSIDLRIHPADPAIAELGYMIGPRARRRGVATRAVELITAWAFDTVAVERVEILVDPRNEPSVRVAESAGFAREGLLRAYRPARDGGRLDLAIFARLRAEADRAG